MLDFFPSISVYAFLIFRIYLFRKIISFYFHRVLSYHETCLNKLRDTQKLKVEELKKKTSYYQTKGLIERYDPNNSQNKQLSPSKLQIVSTSVSNSSQTSPKIHSPTSPVEISMPSTKVPSSSEGKRSFFDRIADAILGEEQNNLKYALICEKCLSHNGLAKPEEVDSVQYFCPKCLHFNMPKKSRGALNGEEKIESLSPLSQARIKAKSKSRDSLAGSKSTELLVDRREKIREISSTEKSSLGSTLHSDSSKNISPLKKTE